MRVLGLFSGGKDSTYAAYLALQQGWEVTELLTLLPGAPDSYLFHVPNIRLAGRVAEAWGLPWRSAPAGPSPEAELRDLRAALRAARVDGVVTGAVRSDYQWRRINTVCAELGLRTFSPLWRKRPESVLQDELAAGIEAIVVGVAAEGLDGSWLGRQLDITAVEDLDELARSHGVSPVGEGGEFETLVLSAPFFQRRLRIRRAHPHWEGAAGWLEIEALEVEERREPRPSVSR